MRSLSIVGLALGVTFGCFLILLVAEVCYFLWWKKRTTSHTDSEKDTNNITGKDLFEMFCEERSGCNNGGGDDPEEGQIQTQAWRYSESPRFLFTIEEGTKEGSESESVNKSSCRVSPCDSFIVETPYFTPVASAASPCLASPITLPLSLNPHFESANDDSAEFNRVKSSSTPPSRFKLLQQTQEKPS
ncbi:hypothetical protein QN277_011607 [Acacia crassicarpa]|uniref:Uncharacterized protein n=1 Tax=Acacia crassicarpa TaxID=499986 RepID=A0AAE1MZ59_9FABA|nr:hypothetical protein QN277_011607 [Acacia crassicarpa]